MARNMFADSKSVDFGFDGSVDIPNQAIYLEERPDDEDFDKELPGWTVFQYTGLTGRLEIISYSCNRGFPKLNVFGVHLFN